MIFVPFAIIRARNILSKGKKKRKEGKISLKKSEEPCESVFYAVLKVRNKER
jgi:hypothetical protein